MAFKRFKISFLLITVHSNSYDKYVEYWRDLERWPQKVVHQTHGDNFVNS